MLNITRAVSAVVLGLWVHTLSAADLSDLQQQVFQRERAFAKTMADRNLERFKAFIDEDAIFFNGTQVLRGREQVVKGWSRLFEGAQAPFSWEPDQVEVLDSGNLALSTGPVLNPAGECVGRFNSIWRKHAGTWRVVFDKGEDDCPGPDRSAEQQPADSEQKPKGNE